MNIQAKNNNKRLLEALDYVDVKYVEELVGGLRIPKEKHAEAVITRSTPLKHWKSIAVLAACTVLLAFAAPTASFISQVISNYSSVAGGNAGAGTSELETPTPTETQALNTEPEMTQVLETDPSETQAAVIDSGFDKALERYADMSADEIYADVLKGGWVVIGEDNSDFAAGKELWFDFFDKSQKGEPAYALIADYARINDQKSDIVLYEIIFDGDLFYYKRMYKNQIVSDEYKYLIHGIATKSTIRFADEAYFLTNYESMTLDDFNENMLSSSTTFPRPVAVIRFKK